MSEQQMRPLVDPTSKFKPVKQIFSGFEIEKRQLLATIEEDHTKAKNSHEIYNEALERGTLIDQGYIKDIQKAIEVLNELGISLNDFKPNTIRLRRFGDGYKASGVSKYKYILTLKDRKETKKREVEFKLSQEQFDHYWPLTKGARVQKKRHLKTIKGFNFEIDAFTDRYLLIAECEVTDEAILPKVPKLGMDITNNSAFTNKSMSR